MHVTIEPYASADALAETDLAATTAIVNAVWAEWVAGERRMSPAAYADLDRQSMPSEVHERRLARDGHGRVVGLASVEWRREEPTVGAGVARVMVEPGARGGGVGRALGEELVAVGQAAGRIGITFETAVDSVADQLCARAGLREDIVIELNRAQARTATYGLLAGWIKTGEEADGYTLVTYDSRCPDDLAEAFMQARHIMNDAPRYLGEPETRHTVEELRSAEVTNVVARHDWWAVGVRHDESGEVVGISDLFLPQARPWIAFQGDTGVAAPHRGHGLGAWMKATNHQRLRRERPEVEVVSTWNATHNEPMLRINRALGFVPAQLFRAWFLPLG